MELANHIKQLQRISFAPTRKEVIQIAFDLAERMRINPKYKGR